MKTKRIRATVKAALYLIAFAALIVACDTEQRMMHGDGRQHKTFIMRVCD